MPNENMDIVEIQYTLGRLIAALDLIHNSMASAPSVGLGKLSAYLTDNQLDFEKAIRNEIKDKGSDYYVSQLYMSLSSYIEWYVANNQRECDNTPVAKGIYDRIVFLWMPPIENIFPNVLKSKEITPNNNTDDKDPEGYNKPFERAGERYRSIRYDITENPDYPYLSADEIYRRLKGLVEPVCGEGVRIATILNIAIKHRLLSQKPQGKSLERELGMTCSYPAVVNVIEHPDDYFNIDGWGKEMEVKLLKQ